MLILGIDTSGREGSVALLRVEGEQLTRLGLTLLPGRQYSELLLSSIAELLAANGLQKSSIGLIGVASGPGSFTGLRIAIATVKGLAEAFAMPVVAISVLEAVAVGSGAEGKVLTALDAQRSEVFWGEYNVESAAAETASPGPTKIATRVSEALASFADFTSRFANPSAAKVFTPDETLAGRLHEANTEAVVLARPSAEDFARIAYGRFLAGVRDDVATLDANYLRRSDAEIFSTPKLGLSQK